MVKLSDEEFLNVVRFCMVDNGFAKDNGFVMTKTISDFINKKFGYTNSDLVEAQILEFEKAGILKAKRAFNMILGVEI